MSAALKLEVFHNGQLLQEVPFEGKDLWVGRDDDCVIRLDDRAISRKHALFRSTAQGIEFEKKTKFGLVRVNGKDSEQTLLKGGDRLEFASFEIRVLKSQDQTVAADPEVSEVVAVSEVPIQSENEVELSIPEGVEAVSFEQPKLDFESSASPVSTEGVNTGAFDFSKVENDAATRVFNPSQKEMKPVLQFGDGLANVTQYELTDEEVSIGRSQKCNVVLEDRKSSRKNSVIKKSGEKFILKDLGSANGTLVNGERVDEHELQSGDVLTIGDTQFTFKLVQADYEQKKEEFIAVPQPEVKEAPQPAFAMFAPVEPGAQFQTPTLEQGAPAYHGIHEEAPKVAAPDFSAPEEPRKSLIGKFLDRYRAMNTKQQIIYGVAILAVFYMILDEEPEEKKAHLNTGKGQVKVAKKKVEEKKPGTGMSFENLTPEQQRYVENQNQLALDYFKNRDYDSALLEVEKIFSLVQDYKGARTIESLSREGKRKLEAQEEERKKRELERQAQVKLQSLIEQAGLYMDKGKFKEAESLFPEIELLQPENTTVSEWRKRIIAENEKIELEETKKRKIAEINRQAWSDYQNALKLVQNKDYWNALDMMDELLERPIQDKKLVQAIENQIKSSEAAIANERDPYLVQGKQFEQEGKFSDAYRSYQKAYEIDPTHSAAPEGMKRIRGTLSGRAKVIYSEGVFAESYGDVETAEKQYRQVLEVVPTDDAYYAKAQSRLRKLTVLRKPAGESPQ